MRRGLLLLNLGTPESPSVPAVRTYLREFLSDPAVIDIPWLFRMLLLHVVILPFRPKRTAAAYAKIWTERGSPLLFHSEDLAEAVGKELGKQWSVKLGMRYGQPCYERALDAFQREGIEQVVVLPLYPQWANSSTGTALTSVMRWMAKNGHPFTLKTVDSFPTDVGFIAAQVARCAEGEIGSNTYWLFSYHGLPERHIRAQHPTTCLKAAGCCETIGPQNSRCYRAHCWATSRALAAELGLSDDQWRVSFQSRLGRAKWLLPSTEQSLIELAKEGKTTLVVVCPSFVSDCLETLEEMDIRGRKLFIDAGGVSFWRSECVNDHPAFVAGVAAMAREA
jgi:ferrochelatase